MDNYIFCATTVLVFAGVVAAKKLISNFQKVFTQIRRTKMHESEVWPSAPVILALFDIHHIPLNQGHLKSYHLKHIWTFSNIF